MINSLLALASPLIIAYLTYLTKKNTKSNKQFQATEAAYKILQAEKADKEKEELRLKDENSAKQFEILTSNVNSIKQDIVDLRSEFDIDKITEQLAVLQQMTEFNFNYTQSFSNVVTTLSEEMVQNIPAASNSLKTAISDHKKNEQKIMGQIIKIIY